MRLVLEDAEQRVLGSADLEGSRWEQVGQYFEPLQSIGIRIQRSGVLKLSYIEVGNSRVYGEVLVPGALQEGSTIIIPREATRLTWTEPPPPPPPSSGVWGERAAARGGASSPLHFARNVAEDVERKAQNLLGILEARQKDRPGGTKTHPFLGAVHDFVLAVLDLLASLKVLSE
jgi:hypothetical protein